MARCYRLTFAGCDRDALAGLALALAMTPPGTMALLRQPGEVTRLLPAYELAEEIWRDLDPARSMDHR